MCVFFSRSIRNVYEAEKKLACSVLGCIQRHLEAISLDCVLSSAQMNDCGAGHFIEFDDPLRLKWRSSSLGAEGILHRQQGNRKKITVPADFIVSLISINQGSKEV